MLSELFFVYFLIYGCFFVAAISVGYVIQKFTEIDEGTLGVVAMIFAFIATETFYKIFF